MASHGDVNRDGFSDVVIGGPFENDERGRVVAFYGGPGGLRTRPDWGLNGQASDHRLGFGLALADVNGDGFSDLIATQQSDGNTVPKEGVAVQTLFGSADGLAASPSQSLPARISHWRLGAAVAAAGDVNGDGFDDVAVAGANFESGADAAAEVLLVFYGSSQGLRSEPERVVRC